MNKELDKDKNYIFSTSIDSSFDGDEFFVELFSNPEDEESGANPDKVIRNFDDLIAFFENLDEEKTAQYKDQLAELMETK